MESVIFCSDHRCGVSSQAEEVPLLTISHTPPQSASMTITLQVMTHLCTAPSCVTCAIVSFTQPHPRRCNCRISYDSWFRCGFTCNGTLPSFFTCNGTLPSLCGGISFCLCTISCRGQQLSDTTSPPPPPTHTPHPTPHPPHSPSQYTCRCRPVLLRGWVIFVERHLQC